MQRGCIRVWGRFTSEMALLNQRRKGHARCQSSLLLYVCCVRSCCWPPCARWPRTAAPSQISFSLRLACSTRHTSSTRISPARWASISWNDATSSRTTTSTTCAPPCPNPARKPPPKPPPASSPNWPEARRRDLPPGRRRLQRPVDLSLRLDPRMRRTVQRVPGRKTALVTLLPVCREWNVPKSS